MFVEKPIRTAIENTDNSTSSPLSICHKSLLCEDPFEHELQNASLLYDFQHLHNSWSGYRLPTELQEALSLISESYYSAQDDYSRFIEDLRSLDIKDLLKKLLHNGRISPSEADLALHEISMLVERKSLSEVTPVLNDKKESWIKIFFNDEIAEKESVCNSLRGQLRDCLADIEAYTIRPFRVTTAKNLLYELSSTPPENLQLSPETIDSLRETSDIEVLQAATEIMTEVFGDGWKADFESRVSSLSAKIAWNERNWNKLGADRQAYEFPILYWRTLRHSEFYDHLEKGIHPINNHRERDRDVVSMGTGEIGRVTCCGSPSFEYPEINYFIIDTSQLNRESIRFAGNHYPCYFDFIPPNAIVGIFQGAGYCRRPTASKQPEKESIIPLLRRAIFYHTQELFLPIVPRTFVRSLR